MSRKESQRSRAIQTKSGAISPMRLEQLLNLQTPDHFREMERARIRMEKKLADDARMAERCRARTEAERRAADAWEEAKRRAAYPEIFSTSTREGKAS